MQQSRFVELSEVRAMAAHLVRERPVPHHVVQVARDAVQGICDEAARYGLTTADVVRAVLRPVFEGRRGCDCPTCKDRRSKADGEQLHRLQTRPSRGLEEPESVSRESSKLRTQAQES